jgi:hypothetical protein
MKKIISLIILFFNLSVFSQSKEFILIDITTKEPIDLVQISYPELQIGSISNEDGRIRIPFRELNIFISHINYIEKTLSFNAFNKKDTLFLEPKTNQLNEIIISNLDLKAKISNILDNTYLKQYSTKKAINKSTYKETFRVNDSLTRLFQVQLDWWSKEYLFLGNKPIDEQNKVALVSVDYSKLKKIEEDFINANGASVENKDFFKFIHLNFLLSIFRDLSSDIVIKSIEKENNSVHIYFDATLIQNRKKIYDYKNSLLVFDKEYNSIRYLKLNMVYDSDFIDDVSKTSKVSYQRKTTKNSIELSFKKLKNNKLALNYFIFEIEGIIKTKNFTNTISSKQSLFISESLLGEKIKKSTIDFYEPFYKNVPTDLKVVDIKVLLTNAEKDFLNTNK